MTAPLPHEGVWTRLGVSAVHGIGVFAVRDIPAGTPLFASDSAPIRWVDGAALADLSPAERAFYDDFAIRRGDKFGCPRDFDLLTPGWYLNRPRDGDAANVRCAPDFAMFADRDIMAGEELTVDYLSFSRA